MCSELIKFLTSFKGGCLWLEWILVPCGKGGCSCQVQFDTTAVIELLFKANPLYISPVWRHGDDERIVTWCPRSMGAVGKSEDALYMKDVGAPSLFIQ